MKKRIVIIASFFVFLLVFTRCCFFPEELGIDPQILPYVEAFCKEAEIRGIHVDKSRLNVSFKNLPGSTQGRSISATNTIFIDGGSNGWKYNPEALVFHEMGHLILGRDHMNEVMNKYCVSIMSNQDDAVYDDQEGKRLFYRREYYVNELFSPGTPLPAWMTKK